MMPMVTDIGRFADKTDGLATVRVIGTKSRQTSLWTRCRVRKNHICSKCRRQISKGDKAYRTIENADYRMLRLCEPCVQWAILDRIAFCNLCEDHGDVTMLAGVDCRNCEHGFYDELAVKYCSLGSDCEDDLHHYGLGVHLLSTEDIEELR